MSNRGPSNLSLGPLLQIGRQASGGSDISIEIDNNTQVSDIGSVIKTKNKRIAAFPDFVMDWLSRQTEEVTTSLFTPPNLTIIPPTSFGQNAQMDAGFSGITQKLSDSFSMANAEAIKTAAGAAYDKTQRSPSSNGSNNLVGNGSIPIENTIKQAK
jgi:hypothetical protein